MYDGLEAFYGGAAGGGKSDALLMAALQYVDVPGYAAILFRRTYADLALPGGLMDRASEWLGPTDARWSSTTATWTFPSGATLSFGYLAAETDKYRYKSAEFQFVGFDEATQFSETQYLYLFSRLRRPDQVSDVRLFDVPLRMRAASNPGDRGHEWVRARFVPRPVTDPISGEVKLEEPIDQETGAYRVFVPARLEDNPYLDQVSYAANLRRLDHVESKRLLAGDWDVVPGGKLFSGDHVHPLELRPADVPGWVRWWDFAATEADDKGDPDFTVGLLIGKRKTGEIVVADVVRGRFGPAELERRIRSVAELDGKAVKIRFEQEPGASGKSYASHLVKRVFLGFDAKGIRSTGEKEVRARPFAAQWESDNVYLVRGPWNADYVAELVLFPTTGVHDDQVDASSGGFESVVGFRRRLGAVGGKETG
jgi:predicted phage terminase large subunit-like protein